MANTRQSKDDKSIQLKGSQTRMEVLPEELQTPKASNQTGAKTTVSSTRVLLDILSELKMMRPAIEELPALKQELRDLKQSFEKMSTELKCMNAANKSVAIKEDINVEVDVSKIKELNDKYWKNALNERKNAFFSAMKNEEKASIFEGFLTREEPFIPRSCREKDIKGWQDSDQLNALKKSREIENTRYNIEKMKTFAETHKKKLEQIEKTFLEKFSHLSEDVLNNLKTLWKKDTAFEEEVSRDIWQEKKTFLMSLPDLDSNIKQGAIEGQTKTGGDDKKKGKEKKKKVNGAHLANNHASSSRNWRIEEKTNSANSSNKNWRSKNNASEQETKFVPTKNQHENNNNPTTQKRDFHQRNRNRQNTS